jgi:hypothetical protein
MLDNARVATRLPTQDLDRARGFYADAVVTELERRGVVFEDVDVPGLRTVDGIADVEGNYPSKGATGERAAWFRDSEGNLLGIGQPIR